GEVIILLEQDDFMRPVRIEKQLAAIRKFPGCSLVTGRFSIYGNEEGDLKPLWPVPQFDGVVEDIDSKPEFFELEAQPAFRALLNRQIAGGNSTLCFTKRTWRYLGRFSEKVKVCADVDFTLRAVLQGAVVVVNHCIVD